MKVRLTILLMLLTLPVARPALAQREGVAAVAQSAQTQYHVHRQLANPSAMAEGTRVEAALYGQYRLYGFDGAPKEAALQVTVPFSSSSSAGAYYFSGRNSAEFYSMFFGIGACGVSAGAYSEYSAALSYAYQIRLSQSSQLAFGVALGAIASGTSYGSLQDGGSADPSLVSSGTLWQFHSQTGVYLHGEKYYVSAYSPSVLSKSIFLQSGYSTAVGGSDDGGYYGDALQKKNRWEVHAQAGWQGAVQGAKIALQGSTVYTINSLLGVGVSWQNPLNLAALAQLNIGGTKICYAYQIANLNVNILQHEIVLKMSFYKKESLY